MWGPLWLIFCSSYPNNTPFTFLDGKKRSTKLLFYVLLFVPQFIMYGIYITDDYLHNWNDTLISPGIYKLGFAYWLGVFISTAYMLAGGVILIRNTKRNCGFNQQLLFILVSTVLPSLISTFYHVSDLFSYFHYFDIEPSTFLLSLVLLNIATYKFNFLSLQPLAFSKIVDNLKDAIIIIDKNHRISSINKSFTEIFPSFPIMGEGSDIRRLIDILKTKAVPSPALDSLVNFIEKRDAKGQKGELFLFEEAKYLSVEIQPLSAKKKIVGWVFTLSDISYYKKIHHKLEEKNTQLELMNKQLKDYAQTAEELAVTKERNRFARDIHDSTGHTMSVLISMLGVCTVLCKDNPAAKVKLEEALAITKEGLGELRRSVYGLYSKNLNTYNMINALKKMIEEFEHTGVKVDLTIDGDYIEYGINYYDIIYKTCQEALTNSLKHGKATRVSIFVEFSKAMIKMFIFDNGKGCLKVSKGLGLLSMEERVGKANGCITYGSDEEQGFHIHIDIPCLPVDNSISPSL